MSKKAAVIGYSGHALVVLDILLSNQYEIAGYCEKESKKSNPYNISYLGWEAEQGTLKLLKSVDCFIGIGRNDIRARIFEYLLNVGISLPAVAHKSAIVSPLAQLQQATVVMPGAIINSQARIGNAVICNSACVIEHECELDDYVHVAPGAVLAGNVKVKSMSFIGANAVVREGVTIGSNVTIGAGAVVVRDVKDNSVVFGNPAKSR